MSLAVSALRSRVSASIGSALGAAGWAPSAYPVDLLGSDARTLAHRMWSVGVTNTTPAALDRQSPRGSATRAAVATTGVLVRWSWRLRADAYLADYDAALDGEELLVAAVLATDGNPGLAVRLVRIQSRQVTGDGTYLVGTVEFECLHSLNLALP